MTVPNTPPPDREEIVEVSRGPAEYQQRQVTRSPAAEQRITISRVTQVLWLLFGFLEALIAIRIILSLIGANRGAFFAQVIYSVTDVFLWPFMGLIPDPALGNMVLEISSIIGMIVYGLIAWGLTKLIWVLFYHPADTTTVSTYREDRH